MKMSAGRINDIFEKNQEALDLAEKKFNQNIPSVVKRAEKHIPLIIEKIKEHQEISRYMAKANELIEAYNSDTQPITFYIAGKADSLINEGYDDAILLAYVKAIIEDQKEKEIEE